MKSSQGINSYWLNAIFSLMLIIALLTACTTPTLTLSPTATPTLTSTPTPTVSPTIIPTLTATPVISPTGVLFIGNSLTFFNDMPDMFAALALAGGHPVNVDMSARSAGTLAEHSRNPATLGKIRRGGWDVVVLQEQSALPANAAQREEKMYPAVRLLDAEIAQVGAGTLFYLTWGYRDGFPDEGHADFAAMQAQLQVGYEQIATELGASVAPVGGAFQVALMQDPRLNLWQMDGVHPTRTGSYLIACVFYAVIFEESPVGLAYDGGLPEAQVQILRQVAAETVLGLD